jgi:hypothetical protein
MARTVNPNTLASLIQKLHQERARHQQRVDEINRIFERCGISAAGESAPVRRGPGRPARSAQSDSAEPSANGRRGRRRRRRGRFGTSGTTSLVEFIKKAGRGGVGSSEIAKHWKGEGRAGQPYITLGHLVKSGKLKKKSVQGQRGSQYFAA